MAEIDVVEQGHGAAARHAPAAPPALPTRIHLADYPQLQRLVWHLPGATELTPAEALGLYERNWRHIDQARMDPRESELLDALVRGPGQGHLLV